MFRLEKLEISGFKSFADRTSLVFGEGITGVVGPNGCGKSNIAEAISWVLGEQSPKNLRGGKMEDVIFNGTPTVSLPVWLRCCSQWSRFKTSLRKVRRPLKTMTSVN